MVIPDLHHSNPTRTVGKPVTMVIHSRPMVTALRRYSPGTTSIVWSWLSSALSDAALPALNLTLHPSPPNGLPLRRCHPLQRLMPSCHPDKAEVPTTLKFLRFSLPFDSLDSFQRR